MLNKVFLIGNLGRDPEVRTTPSGQNVATLRLATSRKWKDRDGNSQEQTEWHSVVCWGRQAEIAGQYLTKGRQIWVEGRLQTQSWEDRTSGEKRYRTEVVCENFQMLGGRGGSGDGPGGGDDVGDGGGFRGRSAGGGGFSRGAAPGAGGGRPARGGQDGPPSDYNPGDFPSDPSDDDIPF
jgi:single-strand DNA-binding protein